SSGEHRRRLSQVERFHPLVPRECCRTLYQRPLLLAYRSLSIASAFASHCRPTPGTNTLTHVQRHRAGNLPYLIRGSSSTFALERRDTSIQASAQITAEPSDPILAVADYHAEYIVLGWMRQVAEAVHDGAASDFVAIVPRVCSSKCFSQERVVMSKFRSD